MSEQAESQIIRLQRRLDVILQPDGLPALHLNPAQQLQFRQYLQLLLQWNQRIDLISPGDESRIAERHILESLAVLSVWPFRSGALVIDLGSGAGFPGIPLKIMRPDLVVTLLESKQKKALFLNTVVRELKLSDCRVVNARAEEVADFSQKQFSIVIARAVAELKKLWKWSQPLLVDGGVLLAMKGGDLENELQALKKFDSRVFYQLRYYPSEWRVDPARCLVIVATDMKSLK
ncbi:MAG: 16S rRNA (guanine(527)-N(7))-methyltransferase RsmG [candidate division KSB1 bacterium]|nr:16S rRNA (guanine(527)-N(7))-methyltransferase RsmG [candidate division KSB1 bacterium]MDZ7301954.1 16S rRNA (guanine(527)-N(7))-methyltransferase RsmG [candidate division KSB1 bacterium]MDZ7312359.1 16S rRNA (guanine(527)-N(7))-methyltransferase RsmG [candidate division KSB1 bacterium]